MRTHDKRRPSVADSKTVLSPAEWASRYAQKGLRVLPVYGAKGGVCRCGGGDACQSPGKHPRTKRGVHAATAGRDVVASWWADWPTANVGVATGSASGVVVIDVDPRNGGDESLARLETELGALPATVEAKPGGGGRHFYFRAPRKPLRGSNGKL